MKIQVIDYGIGAKQLPFRAHYNDAGLDVRTLNNYVLEPHETAKIGLGFGVKIPDGMCGFIFPRSGLSSKGITCELSPIDSGYTGEIHAIVHNGSEKTVFLAKGDRVGQLVVLPIVLPDLTFELGEERGETAFGASGN